MKSKGSFEEIPFTPESLQKLEQLLEKIIPRSYQLLNICRYSLGGVPRDICNTTFYIFLNDSQSWNNSDAISDPFIICIEKPNMNAKKMVIILPSTSPTSEMIHQFDLLMDWTEPVLFGSCPFEFWECYLKPLCHLHAGHTSSHSVKIRLWALPFELGSEIKIASKGIHRGLEYTLASLEPTHVPRVIENWQFAQPHSQQQITKLLRFLPSCGLLAKSCSTATGEEEDSGDAAGEQEEGVNELASSLLVSAFGLFNILYTEEKYRGKGLAPLVIQWLPKHAARKFRLNTLMETEDENFPAIKSLTKCGFQPTHLTNWYWYEPLATPRKILLELCFKWK